MALAVATTALFALWPIDIYAARLFYRPAAVDHWELAQHLPWSVLYRAAPAITASLVAVGLIALATGLLRDRTALRQRAVFLLLSVAVGPGLLVNAAFKDHWDRPRPRDVTAFGGPAQYVTAPLPGHETGTSFPCGHCSVGFLYGAGWWIWKRRRPRWARISLAIGVLTGFALGLGRMAAGGHFLSDVIWSALLAFGVCHILYYHVLRVERAVAAGALAPAVHARWHRVMALLAALGGAGILIALFATPHGTELKDAIALSALPHAPRVFDFEARSADVEIVIVDPPAAQVSVVGELHGFGLPTSHLHAAFDFKPGPEPTLRYRIVQSGWFTDLAGAATVMVPAAPFERIVVRVERGNIRARDETRGGVLRSGLLQLDLKTGSGHVQATPAGS